MERSLGLAARHPAPCGAAGVFALRRSPGRSRAIVASGGGGGRSVVQRVSSIQERGGGGGGPVVRKLSTRELARLLPWSGCGERLAKEVGDAGTCTMRVAFSLVVTLFVYGRDIGLASVAGFYWVWAPICTSMLANLTLRLRYRYAGIWSARVARVQMLPTPQIFLAGDGGSVLSNFLRRPSRLPSTLEVEVGDGIAANIVVQVSVTNETPTVQVGERVEVMVVSDRPSLSRFKALHDVFLPERGEWISEQPAVERKEFEENCLEFADGLPTGPSRRRAPVEERSALYIGENTANKDAPRFEGPSRRKSLADVTEDRDLERNLELDRRIESRERRRSGQRLKDADLYF